MKVCLDIFLFASSIHLQNRFIALYLCIQALALTIGEQKPLSGAHNEQGSTCIDLGACLCLTWRTVGYSHCENQCSNKKGLLPTWYHPIKWPLLQLQPKAWGKPLLDLNAWIVLCHLIISGSELSWRTIPGCSQRAIPVSGSKETTRCVVRTIPSWNSKQPRNTSWSDSALQMFVNLVARSSEWAEAPESNTENLSQSVLNIFGSKINANSLCPTVIMKDQLAQPAGVSQSRQEQICISLWGEKKKSL